MDRFWHKVNKRSGVFGISGGFSSECWEWTAAITKSYGQFRLRDKMVYAHRVAYELCIGPIPQNECVLHRCDNPKCVRPDHLFLGTHDDNMKDMMIKGRHNNSGSGGPPGEQSGSAKLSEKDVLNIRNKFNQGVKKTELARIYGVHWNTIKAIIKRETWKHI